MSTSPLEAIIDVLRADPIVLHALGGQITVYGEMVAAVTGELDGAWAAHMPRRLILVREAGGHPRAGVGPLSWPRFDVRCYGSNAWDASQLSHEISGRLFGKVNRASGIVAVTIVDGPESGREPRTGWAFCDRSYQVLADATGSP